MMPGETVLSGAKHPGTEIRILWSPSGYYLGFTDEDGSPYSRETDYMNMESAQLLLDLIRK